MQAIQEMLLQSWGHVGKPGSSVIRVFPATPAAWADASFSDLRAQGGFRVSAKREHGRTTWVRIAADKPGTFRLLDPFAGRGPVWTGPAPVRAGATLTGTLGAGEALEARCPG
jgi:alpha-L-fucosidase 2